MTQKKTAPSSQGAAPVNQDATNFITPQQAWHADLGLVDDGSEVGGDS
jgi:hypothetical protein